MSEFNKLHEHLKECVDNDLHTGITEDGVEFNIFEWAFGLSVKAKKEHDSLVEIATKHATRADELYEALESTNKELYFVINELNKYKTKDIRSDQLDPPELHDMETCHLNAVLLQKPTISVSNDD